MKSVCVHGLGHIGLPTAAMLAHHNYQVNGYDTDPEHRAAIESDDLPITEEGLCDLVNDGLDSGNLAVIDHPTRADVHLICVPTPMDLEARSANLSYVRDAATAIADRLGAGDLVILESTVPPGTTVDELRPLLERPGLMAGKDFDLAYRPETVLPGNIMHELRTNSRIIGGVSDHSAERTVELYESFVTGDIRTVQNPTTAEFVKLIQNTFRDVNIALANELAKIATDYKIDTRLGIELANAHPRVNIHDPGPGVGGHCLPIDPWFLAHGSESLDLIAKARQVNDSMASYIAARVDSELAGLDDCRIAILGIAYKGNVGDIRMSPGLALAEELKMLDTKLSVHAADGGNPTSVDIRFHDPLATHSDVELLDLESSVTNADAVIITCDHDVYKTLTPGWLASRMEGNVLVDTKNIIPRESWEKDGFSVLQI